MVFHTRAQAQVMRLKRSEREKQKCARMNNEIEMKRGGARECV